MLETEKTDREVGTVVENPYAGREGIPYVRVSDKSQELRGSGQKSQEARFREELKRLNVPYVRSFVDAFTGGGDFMNRPAMRELLAYVDAHPHKQFVVIFDDLKRFARDTEFHKALRRAFKARDIVPICLNFKFEDTPEGEFVETVLAAQAELERKQNQRQTIQKMKARLEQGYWPFAQKRGYKLKKIDGHGKVAYPTAEGRKVIAPALEAFATGNLRRNIDVARFMLERGMWKGRTPKQCLDRVRLLLNDNFYCGDIEYKPWEVSRRKGKHEGLISRETFLLIQKRLLKDSPSAKTRKDTTDEFPLRGLITCHLCGGHLCGSYSRGRSKRYRYYFCQNRACPLFYKSLRGEDVEDDFTDLLERTRMKPDVEELSIAVFDRVWDEEAEAVKWHEQNVEQRKIELQKKMKQLAERAGGTTSEIVARAYEAQIEEAGTELKKLEATSTIGLDLSVPYRTALDKSVGMLKNPVSTWDLFDVHEQQRLFFFLFEDKLAYTKNEGYRTGESLCTTRLFEELATAESHHVRTVHKTLNRLKEYLAEFWSFYQSSEKLRQALGDVN